MEEIARRLLEWYGREARSLPWRESRDPYAVWVSEIMLQQTRVDTVIPYYLRWMERFPTLAALAQAGEEDVLRLWEGLGYYSRARNLHRAAQMVVSQLEGRVPTDVTGLRRLPGVGDYTAGAIASIAYGLDEPALDGNIRRVLARLINLEIPADEKDGTRRLWAQAKALLPAGRAGDFNQALMDLGATVCTPLKPACLLCPLQELCESRRMGVEAQRPVLKEKAPVPHYTVTAAVIWRDGQVLLARRPSGGLLGGMWEFPGGKLEAGESLRDCLAREIREELGAEIEIGAEAGVYEHAYTHFKVTLHAFHAHLSPGSQPSAVEAQAVEWVAPERLGRFPMGKIDRQISRRIIAAGRAAED